MPGDNISAPLFYMPPISVFRQWMMAGSIDFQTDQRYSKMSFSNRCVIATANGMLHLSIPIRGGRGFRGKNSEVMVDNRQAWQLHHWRTIFSGYGRAPWFEHFGPGLEKLYLKPVDSLVDWNLQCLQWICDSVRIKYPDIKPSQVQSSREIRTDIELNPRPSDFQSDVFQPFPAYTQVFQEKNGFLPNLSMLDFVLSAGPNFVKQWIENGID
jgi:hypothetical protein